MRVFSNQGRFKIMTFSCSKRFSTSWFSHIFLHNLRLTKDTAFTLAPIKRALFTPDKSPFIADSRRLSV